MKKLLVAALALTVVACSPGPEKASSAVGDWKVDPAQSTVSFISVKVKKDQTSVAEAHKFKAVNGTVAKDGQARMVVDLASVATENEDRDKRMKELLFEVATHPEAVITAKLDPAKFETLAIGDRRVEPLSLVIDLHGAKSQVDTEVYVTRVADGKILVETVKPFVLEAEEFGLVPGLTKLTEIVELSSITPASPVSFSVMLTR